MLLRTVRLTGAQARRLGESLAELVAALPDGEGARRTVLVTMIQAADPGG